MKSLLIFTVIANLCLIVECFLTYPISSHVLGEFLKVFNVNDKSYAKDLLKHAIPGEKCARKCSDNDHKICYFNFTLKHYQTVGGSCGNCLKGNTDNCLNERCVIADGVGRGYLALNFNLPGPQIHVCKDDIIIVDLHNDAEGLSTALHWHGLRNFGTQFMDGVPYLTQCPIPFGESFRYSFYASDEGTHFYHSHAGSQKADGVYGALIVRGVGKNPNLDLYDYDLPEHTILMADWMHQNAEDHIPGLSTRSSLSQSILINGHGRFFNQTTNTSTLAPLTIFHVEAGNKYRFRVINAGLNVCPFLMQIEDHNMTIIATEVSYVKPFEIGSLYFLSGERYDFVIDTNHRPIKDYWIRFRQLNPCTQQLEGFAILRYHKKIQQNAKRKVAFNTRVPPTFEEEYPNGTLLNSPFLVKDNFAITRLEDFRIDHELVDGKADQTKYLFVDTPTVLNDVFYNHPQMGSFNFITSGNGESFLGTMNNISFLYPSFPLLLEPERVNDEMFCDAENLKPEQCSMFDDKKVCRCIHRLKFKLGSIAELVVVNVDDQLGHPMHLHGHKYHVVGQGILRENITHEEVRRGGISFINHDRPPYKDTVSLPYPGYVRLRFRANNPGYWLFHCHLDWHLPIGMAVLIQVGEVDEMRKPPSNFPRCYNYLPEGIV